MSVKLKLCPFCGSKETFGVTMSQTGAIDLAHLILSALKEASDGHNH